MSAREGTKAYYKLRWCISYFVHMGNKLQAQARVDFEFRIVMYLCYVLTCLVKLWIKLILSLCVYGCMCFASQIA